MGVDLASVTGTGAGGKITKDDVIAAGGNGAGAPTPSGPAPEGELLPLRGSAAALAKAMDESEGLAKVIAHATTDRLLGVHIIGPRASDMIAEAVAVMEFSGSAEDIARITHAHPTLSEVLREAAMAVDKRAIHA